MKKTETKTIKVFIRHMSILALSLIVLFGTSIVVCADEADTKRILKVMSDYMSTQKSLSFEFDATLQTIINLKDMDKNYEV